MNTWKTNIRGWFRPETRGQFYAAAAGLVTMLASLGLIAVSYVPAVIGVAVAVLALIYAYVNSDSAKNKAIYTLAAAIGTLLIGFGTITDSQTQAILAFIAPVLGISYAAAKTPHKDDSILNGGTWTPHYE